MAGRLRVIAQVPRRDEAPGLLSSPSLSLTIVLILTVPLSPFFRKLVGVNKLVQSTSKAIH
jgi:hypothetical protein